MEDNKVKEETKKEPGLLVQRLAQLLQVKSIVTLMLIAGALYGFINKMISAELFASWVSAVITYFFTRKQN